MDKICTAWSYFHLRVCEAREAVTFTDTDFRVAKCSFYFW